MTEAGQQRTSEAANVGGRRTSLTPEGLVRKYASAVLGLCLAHTKNFHDSEDIMQEVFLKAMMKLKTLRDETRARPWLLQIARRLCADYYRQRRPQRTVSEDVPAQPDCINQHIVRLHEGIS
ncbi:MAG: RNA polymerase sigma factor, partial [Planctomycetota bacterium]